MKYKIPKNPSELVAYNYLLSLGYKPEDIIFRNQISPDFLTIDGLQWECKLKNIWGKITFTNNQHEMHLSTRVLIVSRNMIDVENIELCEAFNYKHKHAFYKNRSERFKDLMKPAEKGW